MRIMFDFLKCVFFQHYGNPQYYLSILILKCPIPIVLCIVPFLKLNYM